jgi:hypothetical protein
MLGASCPINSMAPVLAITGMVAAVVHQDSSSTPLERFLNLSQPGRAKSISRK